MVKFDKASLKNYIKEASENYYSEKEELIGSDQMREIERIIMLFMVVDRKRMDHIDAMDQLRQGIGIRSYGQQDPVRSLWSRRFRKCLTK